MNIIVHCIFMLEIKYPYLNGIYTLYSVTRKNILNKFDNYLNPFHSNITRRVKLASKSQKLLRDILHSQDTVVLIRDTRDKRASMLYPVEAQNVPTDIYETKNNIILIPWDIVYLRFCKKNIIPC